ncbi:MAG TPA: sigma-70 family RNA polymerase sigma factor [Verrucomicrobiae bacterium]|nr:sigma-70 family RNA polymerase sigma factor [Verrucomicrobiae bacterium]
MIANDLDLLWQFAREQSQEAFTALVNRHLSLVYSAALRQVRSPHLAEEVSQTVFTRLAREAARLKPDTILTAWLYTVTRHAALDTLRGEARRQAREQLAFQMSDTNDPSADWRHIEPVLDEAMNSLDETDRAALLLRYFENQSLREIGLALGASEDAAQKRVSRALDRLREFFAQRKITVGASGLAALVSANSIQAAPAGLAAAVATGALAGMTAAATSATVTITSAIAMTAIQKAIVGAVLAVAIAGGLYEASQARSLRQQVQSLQEEQKRLLVLNAQKIAPRPEPATSRPAEDSAVKTKPGETLKLRGEVSRLKQENAAISSTSGLSKLTANPEAKKMMREQQKAAMSALHKEFATKLKLAPEQTEKLNDMLADYIMDNVDKVTEVLRDKPAPQQMDGIFAAQEAALQEKLQAMLGADGAAQYQEYSQKLLSNVTGMQFKDMLSGDDSAKKEKAGQITQMMLQATQAALSAAGLPADHQTLPMLDFRNIASEAAGDRSLALMEDIYNRAAASAASFLSPEELKKFEELKQAALKNNRYALTLNRSLMAPIGN